MGKMAIAGCYYRGTLELVPTTHKLFKQTRNTSISATFKAKKQKRTTRCKSREQLRKRIKEKKKKRQKKSGSFGVLAGKSLISLIQV